MVCFLYVYGFIGGWVASKCSLLSFFFAEILSASATAHPPEYCFLSSQFSSVMAEVVQSTRDSSFLCAKNTIYGTSFLDARLHCVSQSRRCMITHWIQGTWILEIYDLCVKYHLVKVNFLFHSGARTWNSSTNITATWIHDRLAWIYSSTPSDHITCPSNGCNGWSIHGQRKVQC